MKLTALSVFLFAATVAAPAYCADPMCISLKPTMTDPVGSRVETSIRSKIILSDAMEDTEDKSPFCLVMVVVTLDPDNNGNRTIYSVVYSLRYMYTDFFLTTNVGYCGSRRVDECAQGLIDDAVVEYDSVMKSASPEMIAAVGGIRTYYQDKNSTAAGS